MQAEIDDANRAAMERTMDEPPSPAVLAYEAVYGREPRGWPPLDEG